jgi:hypothetical protein
VKTHRRTTIPYEGIDYINKVRILKSGRRIPLHGKTLSDLYKLMVNGSLFVNVYTKDHLRGEIRGNSFVPMDDLFPTPDSIRWD